MVQSIGRLATKPTITENNHAHLSCDRVFPCQYIAHTWEPLLRTTTELLALATVLPIWKMTTPLPLRVTTQSAGPKS